MVRFRSLLKYIVFFHNTHVSVPSFLNISITMQRKHKGKRKIYEDDDEEEGEGATASTSTATPQPKKQNVSPFLMRVRMTHFEMLRYAADTVLAFNSVVTLEFKVNGLHILGMDAATIAAFEICIPRTMFDLYDLPSNDFYTLSLDTKSFKSALYFERLKHRGLDLFVRRASPDKMGVRYFATDKDGAEGDTVSELVVNMMHVEEEPMASMNERFNGVGGTVAKFPIDVLVDRIAYMEGSRDVVTLSARDQMVIMKMETDTINFSVLFKNRQDGVRVKWQEGKEGAGQDSLGRVPITPLQPNSRVTARLASTVRK